MTFWVRQGWPVRALVAVLSCGWLAAHASRLSWVDRLWFDAVLRHGARHRPPVHELVAHADIDTAELDRWQSGLGEHTGLAELIGDLRAQGARLIVLDLVLKSGPQAAFEPLWKRIGRDLVLGRTWNDQTRLPDNLARPPASGLMLLDTDSDGMLRRYTLARVSEQGQVEPSLALAAYLRFARISWKPEMLRNGRLEFSDVNAEGMPLRRSIPNEIYLDFRASWTDTSRRNFLHVTPAQLRSWRAEAETAPRLEGRVVFVGYTAEGTGDIGTTALHSLTPKVALHAQALNDLLQNSWHAVASWRSNLLLAGLTLSGAWFAGARLSGPWLLAWAGAGLVALQLGGAMFILHRHAIPAIMSLTLIGLTALAAERTRLAWLRAERERQLQSLAEADDPLLLKRVGNYELVERLGVGGFAAVYRAVPVTDLDPEKAVAVKIVHPAAAESAEFRRRFSREIRITTELKHPCIVRVLESGEKGGLLYLVMELVRGRSLRSHMDGKKEQGQVWNVPQVGHIIERVLQGMAYAHAHRVLHRDLKPENVMADESLAQVKIVDFGLAFDAQSTQLTRSGDVFGTLDYLAPERIQGKSDDPRSDLYAVGVIAYEMLAGKNPFPSLSAGEALLFRLTRDPEPIQVLRPDLTEELAGVIQKMMAREIEQRYPSVADALQAWRSATVGKS